MKRGVWSEEEHALFLQAIRYYPEGPWSKIAGCIGSRSARQVQTHAQRYYEKIQRHVRGLQRDRSKSAHKEHRIDEDVMRLQHVHKVMSSAAAKAASKAEAKTLEDQEQLQLQQRLYRSKDPPPCLQRLAQLPSQRSPVGVHEPMFNLPSPPYRLPQPVFEAPQHHQPLSPLFDRALPRPVARGGYYHLNSGQNTIHLPPPPFVHQRPNVLPSLINHLPPTVDPREQPQFRSFTSYLPHDATSYSPPPQQQQHTLRGPQVTQWTS